MVTAKGGGVKDEVGVATVKRARGVRDKVGVVTAQMGGVRDSLAWPKRGQGRGKGRSQWPRRVQSEHLAVDRWHVIGRGRPPVVEAACEGHPVSETVGDGKSTAAFELSEHYDHLPVGERSRKTGDENGKGLHIFTEFRGNQVC